MASITLYTTATTAKGVGRERQITFRSEALARLTRGMSQTLTILTPKGTKMVFNRCDTHALWATHQEGESLANFETLWAILSTRPNQTLELELESVGEMTPRAGSAAMAPIPMGNLDF